MKSRLEPLLWLQCLAIGTIPLELLLIWLILAGADPGSVPLIERLLVWGVGVLAPSIVLWERPADWGSLLLVRIPYVNRDKNQQALSTQQGGIISRIPLCLAVIGLLPLLWWLDDSAVLASEFSPVFGQSRLVTLLLSVPLLALIVWHLQQLTQALGWLIASEQFDYAKPRTFSNVDLKKQRTSLGLQVLRLNPLEWPEAYQTPDKRTPTVAVTSQKSKDNKINKASASLIPTREPSVTSAGPIETEKSEKQDEGTNLDTKITEINIVTSRSTKEHDEHAETSRSKQSKPYETPKAAPGSK
ncbi:hypothetical protein CREGCYN_14790 [Synechococcus sp. M16CYN]